MNHFLPGESESPTHSNIDFLHGATSSEVVSFVELSYEYTTTMRSEIVGLYGIEEYASMLMNTSRFNKSIVTYSDFVEFPQIMNSFPMFFFSNYLGECYRSQGFYARFNKEHPDLENQLMYIFDKGVLFAKKTKMEIGLLYQAYKIMISYEEVKQNYDLFK